MRERDDRIEIYCDDERFPSAQYDHRFATEWEDFYEEEVDVPKEIDSEDIFPEESRLVFCCCINCDEHTIKKIGLPFILKKFAEDIESRDSYINRKAKEAVDMDAKSVLWILGNAIKLKQLDDTVKKIKERIELSDDEITLNLHMMKSIYGSGPTQEEKEFYLETYKEHFLDIEVNLIY